MTKRLSDLLAPARCRSTGVLSARRRFQLARAWGSDHSRLILQPSPTNFYSPVACASG